MPATATATACVSELLLQMGSIVSGVDSSGGVGDDHGIIVGQRKRGREAPERGRVWEGGVPPPSPRKFCIFVIEIKRSGAHFGRHFLKNPKS